MRNPEWTRDELILGLDVYYRLTTAQLTRNNPQILALSELLNRLPIHPERNRNDRFRNSIGVAMELRGFLRFDGRYSGAGLRGAKLGKEIWHDFSTDIERLRITADAIRQAYKEAAAATKTPGSCLVEDGSDTDVFPEGAILTRLHLLRERSQSAARLKKRRVVEHTGRLACEACNFDFLEIYGKLGEGFAECHHLTPLSRLPGRKSTHLGDLGIVCANCHRMLHRSKQWLTISDLKEVIVARRLSNIGAPQERK